MTTNTVFPDTNEALVEALSSAETLATHMGTNADLIAYLDGSINAIKAKDNGTVDGQIAEQANVTMRQMLADAGYDVSAARPGMAGKTGRVTAPTNSLDRARGKYNIDAPGAGMDDYYQSNNLHPGHWLQAAVRGRITDKVAGIKDWRAKIEEVTAAYGSEVGSEGGYLMPEQLRSELMSVPLESSIVRPRATVFPMSTRTLEVPSIDVTSHASSVFGGVSVTWGNETSTLVESNAQFATTKLEVTPLTGMTRIPLDHLADTQFVGAYFTQTFPPAITFEEDFQYLVGSGVGRPQGALNSTAVVEVAAEGGQSAGTVVYENLVNMYARMIPSSLGTAVWVVSQDAMAELMTMALSVGTGGSAVWLTNAAQGPPLTIFGRPVMSSEKVPALGTAADVSFMDFSKYLIGDRQTMTIDDTDQEAWLTRQRTFRIVQRVDGRSWVKSALTPKNGSSNTLSPFVTLAARP